MRQGTKGLPCPCPCLRSLAGAVVSGLGARGEGAERPPAVAASWKGEAAGQREGEDEDGRGEGEGDGAPIPNGRDKGATS